MRVSIVIPTKDRGKIFDEGLRSIVKATHGIDAEIIVINDSRQSTPTIPSEFTNVRLIQNPKSGVASARNFGASISQAEYLLFIDDDFLIPPQAISLALEIAEQNPQKIHLFNWVYPPEAEHKLSQFQFGRYLVAFGFTSVQGWLGDDWREEEVFELRDGASYFLPIKKSIFNEIGGYNEKFPHAGAEDFDFVQRAKENGIRFYLDKRCLLYHNELDRINLKNWLNRKKRAGETIKMAVHLGHERLTIKYSLKKRLTFKTLSGTKFVLFGLLKLLPNVRGFDWVYFKITNILLAVSLFEGYHKETNKEEK
ncbi:MAG: glycosyltransferase [Bacteroidetes bacterium]|nr:glycosyltransferase [Bacteroidota bacterium]